MIQKEEGKPAEESVTEAKGHEPRMEKSLYQTHKLRTGRGPLELGQ